MAMISCPAWACQESGASPAARRVARTALAFVPAPPATAALTNLIFGYFASKILTMAARPSASPGPTHQENTSTWPPVVAAAVVGAAVAAGASVMAGAEVAAGASVITGAEVAAGAEVGASVAAGVALTQAERIILSSMSTETKVIDFLYILSSIQNL